jgi:hypothetical protein
MHQVSIPIGSEETYSFKFMRKNQFEEALFKCEDDRFEIDLIIDTNASAIRMLEPIADEIATLRKLVDNDRAAPRFSFQLDKRQLGTVHLNAITRLYGDHAAEILELLRKNPAGTIPVVLKRLKQKDLEWRKARQELNKQWKEVVERNYEKSFDHRSFYFRQQDKRAYTAKVLIAEIKTLPHPAPSPLSLTPLPLLVAQVLIAEIKTGALEAGYSLSEFAANGLLFSVPPGKAHLLGNKPTPAAPAQSGSTRSASSSSSSSSSSSTAEELGHFAPQLCMAYNTAHHAVHRDVYRLMCHAAESQPATHADKVAFLPHQELSVCPAPRWHARSRTTHPHLSL